MISPESLKKKTLVKIFPDGPTRNGYTYKVGLNIFSEKEVKPSECFHSSFKDEGFFTDMKVIARCLSIGDKLGFVELLPDSLVYEYPCGTRWITDKFVITEIVNKFDVPKLCVMSVSMNGGNIKFLNETQRSPKVCLAAVKNYGSSVQFLDKRQRSPKVCLAAVKKDGHAIYFLDKSQRSPKVCLAAVKNDGHALHYLDKSQRSPEVCLAAVKENGLVIHHLDKSQRSPEVCIAAVKQCEYAIDFLTKEEKDIVKELSSSIC